MLLFSNAEQAAVVNFLSFLVTRYSITTNLSSRVSRLNPRWNDPNPDAEVRF